MVALLRQGRRPNHIYAELLEELGSAMSLLETELSEDDGQRALFSDADPAPLLEQATADIKRWHSDGMGLVTVLDGSYPDNLRAVHDRPALLFVAGNLQARDERSVAIIGSRRASEDALARARVLATDLAHRGYTIISGLAAGIDTAAHAASLAADGRTIAVIGTGLAHSYPPENAGLQREIASRGAVVSQFWPDSGPNKASFPQRNATMSGLASATVIIEASPRSGARTQARHALAHGRPVFVARELLEQTWTQRLVARPGVSAFSHAHELIERLEALRERETLTA
ncbi:MAG: processing protein [Solirubrobacteraceae bacterium]|nr:processing protein [Solirubrobacteraceae bacterium]